MPQLSAYTAMLWGALASSNSVTVSVTQLRLPRQWLTVFCERNLKVLERHYRRAAPFTAVVTFDGSLTGGGATLQVGVKDRAEFTRSPSSRIGPTDGGQQISP